MNPYWQAMVLQVLCVPVLVGAHCATAVTDTDRLQLLTTAQAAASDALITARRTTQDWKNLLLRGHESIERQALEKRFDTHELAYASSLNQLRVRLENVGMSQATMSEIEAELQKLSQRYRDALKHHGVNTLEAAAAADREAKGADVKTFRTLESLILELSDAVHAQFTQLKSSLSVCTTVNSSSEVLKNE